MRTRLALGLVLATLLAPARAADRDDLYVEGAVGLQGGSGLSRWQGGLVAGYLPVDGLGVGLGFDASLGPGGAEDSAYIASVETRWFLEPFEVSGALGARNRDEAAGTTEWDLLLSGGITALWPLTPSLALKSDLRLLVAVGKGRDDSSLAWGVGGRFLY